MKYFFILGTNPTLSLAELAAVFNYADEIYLVQPNIAVLETDQKITAKVIKKIGGTIKFGLVHEVMVIGESPLPAIIKFAKPRTGAGKFMFGISNYGKNNTNLKVLAMEFKKLLKQSSINSRWVTSREPTLSSVVVEQNKLTTDRGIEIVIIQFNQRWLLGKTLAVQPFKELSYRDYGRPARDDRSGMLPPKLAQIMINLADPTRLIPARTTPPKRLCQADVRSGGKWVGGINSDATILDPFCGSGTIVTEAMLMGYRNIIGSDISPRAILDTKKNINWIKDNFKFKILNLKLLNADAAEISKFLPANSVAAIITEPYLGPQRGLFNFSKTAKELERLYSKSLSEFKKILKSGARVVMVWPRFYNKRKNFFLQPDLNGLKIVNPLPENLRTNIFIKLTDRDTIVYGREQQKVWREIVVLEKN